MERVPGYENKECYRFAATIPAGVTAEFKEVLSHDGTIEKARMRLYIGAQLSVRISPFIMRSNDLREPMIKFSKAADTIGGIVPKDYLDGDDDSMDFELGIPVYRDQELIVRVTNTDLLNDYDFAFDVMVDYMGGSYRLPYYDPRKV